MSAWIIPGLALALGYLVGLAGDRRPDPLWEETDLPDGRREWTGSTPGPDSVVVVRLRGRWLPWLMVKQRCYLTAWRLAS